MKKLISLYLLVFILPIITIAQWSSNPNQNTIIADSSGTQILPHLVTNNQGHTYISWFSDFGEGNFDLYLQKLAENGVKLWDNAGLQISDHLSGTMVTDYDMKLDNEENVILVTQDMRTGTSNVFAYKISPTGDYMWGNDGIQLSNTANFDTSPKIAVADNNDVVFVWPDIILDDTLKSPLNIKRVSSEGVILWETILIDTLYEYLHPQIIAWNDGDFLVSWVTSSSFTDSNFGRTNWTHVFVQKIGSNGTILWENKIQVDSGQIISFEANNTTPYLTKDKNGGAYIMWQSFSPFYQGQSLATTYVNKIDNNGNLWQPNGYNVSSLYGNSHSEAKMEYVKEVDRLIVIWQEYHLDEVNMIDCSGIRGQVFDTDGNYLWADTGMVLIPLNCTMDTSYGHINIDESTNNNVIVTYFKDYSSTNGAETGSVSQIYATTIDLTGNQVWSPQFVPISLTGSSKGRPSMSNLINDQWVVAWEDNIESQGNVDESGIYAQNISVDGKIGPMSVFTKPYLDIFSVVISPNPSHSNIEVKYILKNPGIINIELLDIKGHIINQWSEGNKAPATYSKKINISDLSTGMYFVKVQTHNSSSWAKLIKN